MSRVDDPPAAIAAALDQVGPRLKRLRAQRRMTLIGLAKATGISKSTLSRQETGQRRPTPTAGPRFPGSGWLAT
jgi:DNA-binding XRE family transcriptional regulator